MAFRVRLSFLTIRGQRTFGRLEAIFPDPYWRTPGGTLAYDIDPNPVPDAPDRFLMLKSGNEDAGGGVTQLIVVENWIEKVKQLASPENN